ncbi:neuroplastin [Dermacentor silvarum]|uniref:neuroplastin n=1 Tax=Dermacentor silvarum TaxID=543639 RepID=UPI0018979D25|nr:neuroplastin [Dermacentor silvarum]
MGPDLLWRGLFLVSLMVVGAQGYVHDSTGRVGAGACYRLEEGKRLVLDCDGLSKRSDRFPFAWMKNNRRFLPSSSGDVRLEQTRLIIEKAHREDAGVYMCSDMMSTGYGQSTTGRVLHVATPVDLVPFSPRLVVRDGSTMRLRCNASAVPRPEVSWWKDGEPLPGGGRVRLLHGPPPDNLPLAQLEISFMGPEDEAVYACKASHPACELSATTSTRVFVRMNAIQTNEEIPGKGIILDTKSHTLALQCNYTDDPSKEILWYKDGSRLSSEDKKYSINSDSNTLEVNDPGYLDTGNYTCVVVGTEENATIVVQTNVSIEYAESSKNQVEGDPLTLSCKASGVPTPVVTWFKDDEPLNISDPRVTLEPINNVSDAKLVIQDLNFDDRAQYTCVASNGISNETMTVLVRVKDKLAALWPFLGICVEVAVLCAIIFIYEKKRVKPDFEESDTDQNPENKNLSDQKEGQDIRQRK